MRLLFDTQLLIWLTTKPEKLSAKARTLIEDRGNETWFSAVNIWEIAIKRSLNRPDFLIEPAALQAALLADGFNELPLYTRHAIAVRDLPRVHGDPFDRVLVAQASTEELLLVTCDTTLTRYPAQIMAV